MSKIANTEGEVVGTAGAGDNAKAANPPIAAETPKEKNIAEKWKDTSDQWIDKKVADLGYSQTAMISGALSKAVIEVFVPMQLWEIIPLGKGFKLVKKGAEVAGVAKKGEHAAEAAVKTESKAAKTEAKAEAKAAKDTKIKPIRKKKVKCFCVDDHAKGGRDEYKRQLDNQQKGINDKTVDQYLADRAAFDGKDPCSGAPTQNGKTSKRNPARAKDAKDKWQNESAGAYAEELVGKMSKGKEIDEVRAKALGKAKTRLDRRNQNALHNSDMKTGGADQFGSNGSLSAADFGDAKTNQHIGTQWKGDRIDSMDQEACQAKQDGKGNEKMNVELRPCGKHEAKAAGCKHKKRKP
jgi:Novel toxin 15